MTSGSRVVIMLTMARRGKVPEKKQTIARSAGAGSSGNGKSVPPAKLPAIQRDVSPPPPRERIKDAPAPGEVEVVAVPVAPVVPVLPVVERTLAPPAEVAAPSTHEESSSDAAREVGATASATPQAAEPEAPAELSAPPPPPPQPPLLFEIAWEVCWQLGGIYTVLRSKADSMKQRWLRRRGRRRFRRRVRFRRLRLRGCSRLTRRRSSTVRRL